MSRLEPWEGLDESPPMKMKPKKLAKRYKEALLEIGWHGNLTAKEMQQIARKALNPRRDGA